VQLDRGRLLEIDGAIEKPFNKYALSSQMAEQLTA